MNMQRLISIFAIIGSLALLATTANAMTRTVDCDKGQSINAAINKGFGSAEPLVINVSGTCTQIVNIRRDDVSINGNNNATVYGTIHVDETNRITLSNIRVTGEGQGIKVSGSNITLINMIVTGNQDVGIQVFASRVAIYNTSVTYNQGWTGIQAGHGSTFYADDSEISYNSGHGIFVDLNSMLKVSTDNVVKDNAVYGILLTQNSSASILDGASISGNDVGVAADMNSVVELEYSDVSNNIRYGILISRDSAATLYTGTTITGNGQAAIQCSDTESSYENVDGVVDGLINCTDFNQ